MSVVLQFCLATNPLLLDCPGGELKERILILCIFPPYYSSDQVYWNVSACNHESRVLCIDLLIRYGDILMVRVERSGSMLEEWYRFVWNANQQRQTSE